MTATRPSPFVLLLVATMAAPCAHAQDAGREGAVLLVQAPSAAGATPSPRVDLRLDALFFGDNTEFRNPFREGETIFGTALRLYGVAKLNDRVEVGLGFVGNTRYGAAGAFDVSRPLVNLTVLGRRSAFTFGTFTTRTWRSRLDGPPDRSGPHGLLPALQGETLTFTRPSEAGLQWTFSGARLRHEAWINWQRLNTAEHRERFDAGASGEVSAAGVVRFPFQLHVVHEGGQLYASGAVRDSAAAALGVAIAGRVGPFQSAGIELFGLGARHVPDRGDPRASRTGRAFLGRASLARDGWGAHVLFWRGDDFVKDEGDPNYQSIRRDGSRYRGIRDYAEAGLTRAFRPVAGVTIAASARLHRTERHYEYSYRVTGAAGLRWTLW